MSWGNPNLIYGHSPNRYAKNKRLALIRRVQLAKQRREADQERRRMETAIDELDSCLVEE